MQFFPKFMWMIAVAGVIATMTPIAASAAIQKCTAVVDGVITVKSAQSTLSKTFKNLEGASLPFNISGTPQCMVIEFSSQMRAEAPQAVRIRVTLDGVPVGFPAAADFTTYGNGYDGRAVTFFLPAIAAGNHVVQIQFQSVKGGTVSLAKGLLKISYDPGH